MEISVIVGLVAMLTCDSIVCFEVDNLSKYSTEPVKDTNHSYEDNTENEHVSQEKSDTQTFNDDSEYTTTEYLPETIEDETNARKVTIISEYQKNRNHFQTETRTNMEAEEKDRIGNSMRDYIDNENRGQNYKKEQDDAGPKKEQTKETGTVGKMSSPKSSIKNITEDTVSSTQGTDVNQNADILITTIDVQEISPTEIFYQEFKDKEVQDVASSITFQIAAVNLESITEKIEVTTKKIMSRYENSKIKITKDIDENRTNNANNKQDITESSDELINHSLNIYNFDDETSDTKVGLATTEVELDVLQNRSTDIPPNISTKEENTPTKNNAEDSSNTEKIRANMSDVDSTDMPLNTSISAENRSIKDNSKDISTTGEVLFDIINPQNVVEDELNNKYDIESLSTTKIGASMSDVNNTDMFLNIYSLLDDRFNKSNSHHDPTDVPLNIYTLPPDTEVPLNFHTLSDDIRIIENNSDYDFTDMPLNIYIIPDDGFTRKSSDYNSDTQNFETHNTDSPLNVNSLPENVKNGSLSFAPRKIGLSLYENNTTETPIDISKSTVKDHEFTVKDHEFTVKDHKSTDKDRRSKAEGHISTVEDRRYTVEDHRSTVEDRRSAVEDRRFTGGDSRFKAEGRISTVEDHRSAVEDRKFTGEDLRSTVEDRRSTVYDDNESHSIEKDIINSVESDLLNNSIEGMAGVQKLVQKSDEKTVINETNIIPESTKNEIMVEKHIHVDIEQRTFEEDEKDFVEITTFESDITAPTTSKKPRVIIIERVEDSNYISINNKNFLHYPNLRKIPPQKDTPNNFTTPTLPKMKNTRKTREPSTWMVFSTTPRSTTTTTSSSTTTTKQTTTKDPNGLASFSFNKLSKSNDIKSKLITGKHRTPVTSVKPIYIYQNVPEETPPQDAAIQKLLKFIIECKANGNQTQDTNCVAIESTNETSKLFKNEYYKLTGDKKYNQSLDDTIAKMKTW